MFEQIISIRALSDGSLLVSDRAQQALLHVRTFSTLPVRIGRIGSGPGEYRSVSDVWPLGADSSLLIDGYSGRWLVLRNARVVSTLVESRLPNLQLRSNTWGASGDGAVIGLRGVRFRQAAIHLDELADSLAVLRASIHHDTIDTLAMVAGHGAGGYTSLAAFGERPAVLIPFNPLSAAEQVLWHADGWLSVVRLSPFRVDWRRPDGTWVHGAAIPEAPRVADRDEQCAAIARLLGDDWMPCDPSKFPNWPRVVPPVPYRLRALAPTIMAVPRGRIAIARIPALGDKRRSYDIVDRRALRVGTLTLALGETLVGSSARYAYVAYTDNDGLQTLRRYDWPPSVRAPAR